MTRPDSSSRGVIPNAFKSRDSEEGIQSGITSPYGAVPPKNTKSENPKLQIKLKQRPHSS
jgi:hypothetical protein